MSSEINVRISPHESGMEIFAIHSSFKVETENQVSNCYEIRLLDNKEG